MKKETAVAHVIFTITIEHDENVSEEEVIQQMDYKLKCCTKGAKFTESKILRYDIFDSIIKTHYGNIR